MRRFIYLILMLLMLSVSCTDDSCRYEVLDRADSIMSVDADSALNILNSMSDSMSSASDAVRNRYYILLAKAQNKAFVPFTSDGMMKTVAGYYDRHGSANERMLAHYLLGCVYRDLDSIPLALQCYENAASMADTMSADCDYATLCRIYGQSSDLFEEELMPRNMLETADLLYKYAMKAKDTLTALQAYDTKAVAYYLLSDFDMEIKTSEKASRLYKKYGFNQESALALGGLIVAYSERKDFKNALRCIKCYEAGSGYFDENGNIEHGREIYYYNKGLYFLGVNKLDSSLYYFRKLQKVKEPTLNQRLAASRGLTLFFEKNGQKDSALKYSLVSYELNDSICTDLMKSGCSSVQAQYEHNRLQIHADMKELEAQKAKLAALTVFTILLAVIFIVIIVIRKHREEAARQQLEYEHDRQRLVQAQTDLQRLLAQTEDERNALVEEYRQTIEKLTYKLKAADTSNVEERLQRSPIAQKFLYMSGKPDMKPSASDWRELRAMFNAEIPGFYAKLNSRSILRIEEYDLCMLVRLHFKPSEMSNMTGIPLKSVSAMRRRMTQKILGQDGSPKDLDEFLLSIKE